MNRRIVLALIIAVLVAAAGIQLWRSGAAAPAPTIERPADAADGDRPIEPASGELASDPERGTVPDRVDVGVNPGRSAGQGVRGRVVAADGTPIEDATVYLMEGIGQGSLFERMALARDDFLLPPVTVASTDEDGEFELGLRKSIGEKKYEVRAIHDRFADAIVAEIQVEPAEWFDVGDVTMPYGIVIEGRVTMAGTPNIPVADAIVRARVLGGVSTLSPPPGRELGIMTKADANGHYRIENASRGTTTLSAMAPGFAKVERPNVIIDGNQRHEFDFELPQGKSIGGQVVDALGHPISRAKVRAVTVSHSPALWSEAYTDSRGIFEVLGLVDGPYTVRVQARGFVPVTRAPVSAGVGDLQITVEEQCEAKLRVMRPGGASVDAYRASVLRFVEGHEQLGSVAMIPAQRVRKEDLDRGVFTIAGIDPGAYVVEVVANGFAKTFSEPFRCELGAPPPLVDVVMTEGGTITGRVFDSNGRPLEGASVSTLPNDATDNPLANLLGTTAPARVTTTTTRTDSRGDFSLPQLAAGVYQIKIEHPEHAPWRRQDIALADGERVELEPETLERGAEIVGTVVIDGARHAHVKVSVASVPDPTDPSRQPVSAEGITDANGDYALGRRLPAGRYSARAARQLPGNPMAQVLDVSRTQREFVLEPGQQSFTLNFTFQSTGPIGR
ncbi:MAG: carboxypeptidase regulatory-like domain-containing protein [Planctomycetes bacterium]|nr:carboxypeptidase regulatory-like domain-containing protein [Planctomycetota bacterium]